MNKIRASQILDDTEFILQICIVDLSLIIYDDGCKNSVSSFRKSDGFSACTRSNQSIYIGNLNEVSYPSDLRQVP